MREFVKPTVRMHYSIVDGGDVPNVVPAYAKLWCWLRDSKGAGVQQLLGRARRIAEGAAMMAEVEAKLTVQGGDWETLVNIAGEKAMFANLQWLGPIRFTPEEQEFAKEIQRATGAEPKGLDGSVKPWTEPKADPEGGSTDVGDVSWIVPTLSMEATTAPEGTPWHAWPVVACGGTSIGQNYLRGRSWRRRRWTCSRTRSSSGHQAEFRKTKGVVQTVHPRRPPPLRTARSESGPQFPRRGLLVPTALVRGGRYSSCSSLKPALSGGERSAFCIDMPLEDIVPCASSRAPPNRFRRPNSSSPGLRRLARPFGGPGRSRRVKISGPGGFTVPVCKIDLRVGGTYLYCMRSPLGKDYWNTGVYREIVVPERIVATDSFADEKGHIVPASHYGMNPAFPLVMLVKATFERLDSRTKLTLEHSGLPVGLDRAGAREGWSQSLDKLAKSLKRPEGS
jgi:uncharacterized protein YndB with AHSA1/START domain